MWYESLMRSGAIWAVALSTSALNASIGFFWLFVSTKGMIKGLKVDNKREEKKKGFLLFVKKKDRRKAKAST